VFSVAVILLSNDLKELRGGLGATLPSSEIGVRG